MGHQVHLFSHAYLGSTQKGIQHYQIPQSPLQSSPLMSLFDFVRRCRNIFRSLSFDKNSFFFAFDLHNTYLLTKITGSPVRVTFVRGHPNYHARLNNLKPFDRRFIEFSSKRGLHLSQRVVFNSHALAADFCAAYGEVKNRSILYNDRPAPSSKLQTSNFPAPDIRRPIQVGFIGQLIARKNPVFLIEQVKSLLMTGEITLTIKGDGTMRAEVERIVAAESLTRHVRFEDWSSDVSSFYSRIDILIVPSVYDECPNVILESFGHPVAVLGARTGGIPELLDFNDDLLFPLNDGGQELRTKVEGLVRSVGKMEAAKQLCQGYGKRYEFNWEEMALAEITS